MSLLGKTAPAIKTNAVVQDEVRTDLSLESLAGDNGTLLFFYPCNFVASYAKELWALQEVLHVFEGMNVKVLGCSCDSVQAHQTWLGIPKAEGGIKGITFPLLSDTSKIIASNFDVLAGDWDYTEKGQLSFSGTATAYPASFFVDKTGIVRYISVTDFDMVRDVLECVRVVTTYLLDADTLKSK
ncbi:MAG: redoxin domain-containing protein [Bacteroidota bacterium]